MIIKNALDIKVKFPVWRNSVLIGELAANQTPIIKMISSAEIKTSISGEFSVPDNINLFSDLLCPIIELNGNENPVGKFMITTATESYSEQKSLFKLEGYDLTYKLKRQKAERVLHFDAGAKYTEALVSLIVEAGLSDMEMVESDLTFATDREDWKIGTSYLEIINQLLDEMGYRKVYADNYGTLQLKPYEHATMTKIDHEYTSDDYSIIKANCTLTNDIFNKCNVFIVICENSDFDGTLIATSINDDENIPFSTVNIGRVPFVQKINNISSQEALQNYADNLKLKSLMSDEVITFTTALNPQHSVYDVLSLDHERLSGIFEETEWNMQLSGNGEMTHKARRVIY